MPIVSEPIGRVLGNRYRLLSALGTGASAHVFLAEDMVLQRRVAVKVLQPALARDESFLRRFRAEARSVAAMNHPHVLRVFDWGEDDDGPYLVLEYLEGGSLFDVLSRGTRLTPAQAARVGAQAAEGLAYAHARGLVHRDVKPANILFDEEGRVRVADFGVARALAGAALTEPVGTMIGTARYASPEQAQGRPLDGRSDVYSLALVLFEAVTGRLPFTADTPLATLQARVGAALPYHPSLGPLDQLLAAAASPDPTGRPDAAALALWLDSLADALPPPDPVTHRYRWDVAGPDPRAGGTFGSGPAGLAGLVAGDVLAGGDLGDATLAVGAFAERTTSEPTAAFTLGGRGHGDPAARPPGAILPAPPAPMLSRSARRRRWPWLVAVGVVVACLAAAGALYLVREKVFTPSHPVPALVGRSLAVARRAIDRDHFRVRVEPAVHSLTVKAGSVVSQHPGKGVSLKQGSVVSVVPSSGLPSVQVPSLSGGIDCAVAERLLAEAHLEAQCPALEAYTTTIPAGDVINWSYDGKLDPTTAPYGSTIAVAVSRGRPPVPVPSLGGDTYTQAAAALEAVGLGVKQVQAYSTTVPAGQVMSTTPATGATAPYGATVTVTVSKGPHMVTVPDVTKDTVAHATAALQKAGLTVGAVYGPATGKVFTTVPLAGQQAKAGSAVVLYTQ